MLLAATALALLEVFFLKKVKPISWSDFFGSIWKCIRYAPFEQPVLVSIIDFLRLFTDIWIQLLKHKQDGE